MRCGLLGEKLGHSYSPQIHALLGDYSYELFEKNPLELKDKCLRSLGILKFAHMLPSGEALGLVSNVCMGVNAGIIKNIDVSDLRRAMFSSMPATLVLEAESISPQERDVKRAQIIQNSL